MKPSFLYSDLRYGARMLARDARFTMLAILILAVGVGANGTIFSVANAVLFEPLPYKQETQLVTVASVDRTKGRGQLPASPADFMDWKSQNEVFQRMASFRFEGRFNLTGTDQPERRFLAFRFCWSL